MMNCPSCANAMTDMVQDSRLGDPVDLDVCIFCQSFWFDQFKNLQLSAGATLNLMKFISEHPPGGPINFPQIMPCPRCRGTLLFTNDIQRATRFQYWRCENQHGRFIGFMDFLREKDYIRPLSPEQIKELRKNIQIVSCSHCGAPIDLTKDTACSHCGSPLSLLDMRHPQQLISQLQKEAGRKPLDPETAEELARMPAPVTQHVSEASFVMFKSNPNWVDDVNSSNLVHAGLSAVARWLSDM